MHAGRARGERTREADGGSGERATEKPGLPRTGGDSGLDLGPAARPPLSGLAIYKIWLLWSFVQNEFTSNNRRVGVSLACWPRASGSSSTGGGGLGLREAGSRVHMGTSKRPLLLWPARGEPNCDSKASASPGWPCPCWTRPSPRPTPPGGPGARRLALEPCPLLAPTQETPAPTAGPGAHA